MSKTELVEQPTPRTDAEHERLLRVSRGSKWIAGLDYVSMRKLAEKLERELAAAAREALAKL